MRRLSELEKAEVWDRFEAGESQRSISRRLGRSPSTIRTYLLGSGFRRPVPGTEWSSLRLSLTEREEISRGLASGETMRCIASGLGRAGSTVSREVAANGGHTSIGRRQLIGRLDIGLEDRNRPSWVLTTGYVRWLRRSSSCGGHQVRYRIG